jgi:putative component of membrane protein insertase Oxa1/YidC/SpoIIIJ protein YidD
MSRQTEQETVREYCCRRKLHRPPTKIKTLVGWILIAESLSLAIAILIDALFKELELSQRFSYSPSNWQSYASGSVIALAVCSKKILVTIVELYQRYASDEVRRKCILMPSCSEYAILALHKYGVVVGVYKIYLRLTRTCRGNNYRIDYP